MREALALSFGPPRHGLLIWKTVGNRLVLVAEVFEQDIAQFISGAPPERIEDHFMLPHRFSPSVALGGEVGGVAKALDLAAQGRVRRP